MVAEPRSQPTSKIVNRGVLDGQDPDDRVGGRQQFVQLPILQGQLVDHPHQPFDIGAELFELGLILRAEFLESYDLFAEPGFGVRGLPATLIRLADRPRL